MPYRHIEMTFWYLHAILQYSDIAIPIPHYSRPDIEHYNMQYIPQLYYLYLTFYDNICGYLIVTYIHNTAISYHYNGFDLRY